MIQEIIKKCFDVIYPRRCPICGDIVMPKGEKACPGCRKSLQTIQGPRCMKCSKPLESEEVEFCFDCNRRKFSYERGFALWIYDARMQKSIAEYKFHGRREYCDFYIEELQRQSVQLIRSWKPDGLIAIPLHKSKQRVRGFNQAEEIAKGMSAALQIPLIQGVLVRNKKTLPQKELNDHDRQKNVSGAFIVNIKRLQEQSRLRCVILVDDIYTTGSTIEACTKVLQDSGVEKIYFLSLCIGKGF